MSSYQVGTIRGIPIFLHWSLVLIFGLLTVSLAAGYFPNDFPELGTPALWAIGAVTSALFLGSILLHELGHALVAQRDGVGVRRITLLVFGGIAELEQDSPNARTELRIAAAGPLVSVALSVIFLALWFFFQNVALIAAPAVYLARINLILALFNLIPGFPLDGGRILRAIVWQRSGSRGRADKVAGASGQIVALLFFGAGLVFILNGYILNGIWIAAIGWFLQNAASASTAHAGIRDLLHGARVVQAMHGHIAVIPGRMMLRQLVDERVLGQGERFFVVSEDGAPRGVVSLTDILQIPRERWDWVPAQQIMVPWSQTVRVYPQTPLLDALHLMSERNINQVPVAIEQRVLGMLSRDMILQNIRIRTQLQSGTAGSEPAQQPQTSGAGAGR